MKKIFILFATVFAFNVGCFANSTANVATDSISDEKQQETYSTSQRPSMRGMKAFVETGFLWSIDECDYNYYNEPYFTPNLWPITASIGYQINNYIFVGGGTGFHLYATSRNSYLEVPVFGEFRVNFFNKKVTPFFDLRSGVTVGAACGFYGGLGLGVRFSLKNRHALYAVLQHDTTLPYGGKSEWWDAIDLGFKAGFEF